jgi:hypothetical protein
MEPGTLSSLFALESAGQPSEFNGDDLTASADHSHRIGENTGCLGKAESSQREADSSKAGWRFAGTGPTWSP